MEHDTAATVLQIKIAIGDIDVFLNHNSEYEPVVKTIGERLEERNGAFCRSGRSSG